MALLTEYQASLLARATVDTAVGGSLVGLKADLTQTDVPINPSTLLADLVAGIATFSGYAQGVVTWDAPSVSADGTVECVGTLPVWRPTDALHPNVIYDIYFTAAVGGALYLATRLDGAPVPMGSALNQLIVTVRYRPGTQSLVVSVD